MPERFPKPTADFTQRFCILNLKAFPKSKFMSSRKVAEELLGSLEIAHTQYRLGITKVQVTRGAAETTAEVAQSGFWDPCGTHAQGRGNWQKPCKVAAGTPMPLRGHRNPGRSHAERPLPPPPSPLCVLPSCGGIMVDALLSIQWNARSFMTVKNWPWMRLFFKIKPLVKSAWMGKKVAGLKEECVQLQRALEKPESHREKLEAKQVYLIWERNDLLF
ncbi:Myosin-15 [Myotis brandtii]|uniref:Myosin-15 n=1 Tax=Myotis brandtii TaxID=109478 RepID=S7MCJ2_MYOBR|nr:Myosin-15 [Myotis brandtii]